jgi:hypothetical protein
LKRLVAGARFKNSGFAGKILTSFGVLEDRGTMKWWKNGIMGS